MPDERGRPPRWLKPVNKLLMAMLRLGLPISGHEAPARPVLRAFAGLAGRLPVFRIDSIT